MAEAGRGWGGGPELDLWRGQGALEGVIMDVPKPLISKAAAFHIP